MHLMARVKRIERGVRPAGGCAACRGEGPLPPHYTLFDDEPLPPMPACTGCGKQFSGPFRVVRRQRVEDADAA